MFTYDKEHLLDVFVGQNQEDRKRVKKAVFEQWYLQDAGLKSYDYYLQCIQDLPERLHPSAYNIIFHWEDEFSLIKETHEFLYELKRNGKKLYLLSNMPEIFCYHYKKYKIFELFDGIVFSFNEKTVKPEKKIYLILLDRYHLNAKESIFIDDNKENVIAAKNLGMDGYLFHPYQPDELVQYIKKIEKI